jgi:hypothetical protein
MDMKSGSSETGFPDIGISLRKIGSFLAGCLKFNKIFCLNDIQKKGRLEYCLT